MKQRLIDLLNYGLGIKASELTADWLIRNGVIAPPCNVDDTAYMITKNGDIRYLTVTHIDITLRKNETEIICTAEYDAEIDLALHTVSFIEVKE